MSTYRQIVPNEQLVHDIAQKVANIALRDSVHVDQWITAVANSAFGDSNGSLEERMAYHAAVARRMATVKPSWLTEQLQEFECEVCTKPITAYPCVLCEHEPDPWKELAEQPQDDGDVRAVAALLDALKAGGRGWGETDALLGRFADRIAALEARDATVSGPRFANAAEAVEARAEQLAAATTGWILWDAEGRWLHATTSPSDDGWRAVSINEAEAQEWQQRGSILDRMDEAGWRAYHEGDLSCWQFDPGSRDVWLTARDAKDGGVDRG